MAKNTLQYFKFGSPAHDQIEHVATFRESASAGQLEMAIDRAQTALGAVDAIMGREKLSDGGAVKELVKTLAGIKARVLGASAGAANEARRSTQSTLTYLDGDRS